MTINKERGAYSSQIITNQTFYIHQESKKLLTRTELLILLAEGFEDVSYGNDECASFARPDNAFINGGALRPHCNLCLSKSGR